MIVASLSLSPLQHYTNYGRTIVHPHDETADKIPRYRSTLMYSNPAIFSNHDLPLPHILSFFLCPPGLFCFLYVGCTRGTPPLIQNSTNLKNLDLILRPVWGWTWNTGHGKELRDATCQMNDVLHSLGFPFPSFSYIPYLYPLQLNVRSPSHHRRKGQGLGGKGKVGCQSMIGVAIAGYTYAETRCPPGFSCLERVVT